MMRNQRLLHLALVICLVAGALGGSAHAASASAAAAMPPPQGGPPGGASFTPAPGTLSTLPTLRFDNSQSANLQQGLQRMSRMEPVVRELQGKLDASQFDLDTLGAGLNYDASAIIAFVRTQIAFEQYPGVLRGDFGTLIGRAGNAFDKALLLRRLLDDAGYETRLVRTTLTEAQARALVAQMAGARPSAPPIADPAVLADIRSRLQDAVGVVPGTTGETSAAGKAAFARDVTGGDASLILQGLSRAGVKLGQDTVTGDLAQEARDYGWVQYRLGSFDRWTDVHPAFASAADAPVGLKIEKYYRDALPDDLYHRFRLQVTVEQKLGDKLVTSPVVPNWERNSADLAGHPVAFQNQPDNLDFAKFAGIDALVKGVSVFVPVVDGEVAARAFDLRGGTYSASLLSLGAIGLAQSGQASSAAAGQATGALAGSGGSSADYMTLTAEWIDYTLVAPGGKETTARRYVLDRVGEANRSQGKAVITDQTPLAEAAKALLTAYTILVLPGEYSSAYISHRTAERTLAELALRPYLKTDMKLSDIPQDAVRSIMPSQDIVLNGVFANAVAPGSGVIAYRAAPALVICESGFVPGRSSDTAYERVDVIRNARRVFSVKDGSVTPAPEEAVRIGAWETYAERVALRQAAPPFGALTAIRQAAEASIPLRVLKPGDRDVLAGLSHSDATKASVQADLDAGYAVILPERPAEPGARSGWWRVNPATGETLGIGTGGYGDSMVEYAFLLNSIVLALVEFGVGTANCTQATNNGACCVISNLVVGGIFFGAGLGIGAIAGLAISSAAVALTVSFLLGDVGLGVLGLMTPTLCNRIVPEPVQ